MYKNKIMYDFSDYIKKYNVFLLLLIFLNADAEYFIYGKAEDTANCLWKT